MSEVRSRVLVVDDDPGRLQTIRNVLSAGGYDVVTAHGGTLGLERLGAETFSLMLTDQRMPDMSGLELLAEARAVAPHVPVMILTAYGSTAVEAAVRKLGAVAYIDGLWDADILTEMVRKNIATPSDAKRTLDGESRELGPATQRWVGFIVGIARSNRDLATLPECCEELGTSLATLRRSCDACEVHTSGSLDFARALRIVMQSAGLKCKWYDALATSR